VQSISVGELKSVATAGGWWSDSGLLLRGWSQAKGFHQSSCCLGGLIHDRVLGHAPHESQPLQRCHPRPCLDAKPQSQQRLRLLRRTISTESDEQLQEQLRDYIDRKQPTATSWFRLPAKPANRRGPQRSCPRSTLPTMYGRLERHPAQPSLKARTPSR
jgi:hypothetical protein